jgi:hypothetical protein
MRDIVRQGAWNGKTIGYQIDTSTAIQRILTLITAETAAI